jgi:hypothetical protein
VSFGDRLDALMTRLVAGQRDYAQTIAKICLVLFVLNCAAAGFSAVVAPAAVGHFAFGAAMFLVGSAANFLLGAK